MNAAQHWRLAVEHLEERLTPTWGVPWYSPTTLTLSFAPDGTDVSGTPSSLFSLLGSGTASWQRDILRAFQTWAIQTNINIGLVPDSGQPLGSSGPAQGDSRFGDIRIAARPLSTSAGDQDLAAAVGFDPSGGTWSGDLVLNSQFNFGIGGAARLYDLYSVALHEAGHSLGFGDDPSNPASVLYPNYSPRTGLAAVDVAAVQALYSGARAPDAFEGISGDDTLATAFDLTANGNLTAVSADVNNPADADVYRFTTPPADSGITDLTIDLNASGISLLTGRLTVLDARGDVLAGTVTTDPLHNDLSLTIPDYSPATTYYVKVEGADTSVFSAGAYTLRLAYSEPFGNSFGLDNAYVNQESGDNDTRASAQSLGATGLAHATAFAAVGTIDGPSDADWYRITPTSLSDFTGTLTVGVVPLGKDAAGVRGSVAVFDAEGNPLPAVVVTHENGVYTVQLADQHPGTTYFLRVGAANPDGNRAAGGYALDAHLTATTVTRFDPLTTITLNTSTDASYSRLTLQQGKLMQFSLSAVTGNSAADSAVRMTIVDGGGNTVFTTATEAGQPLATGTVWLSAGSYMVVFTAATRDGNSPHTLAVFLGARERSDPMDPYPVDPLSPPPPPPPGGSLVLGPPGTQQFLPIIDPIASPFLGLD